jgi:prephenate dehydrogenase
MIQRLCIIGVGLIGGSLARALRSAGVVSTIVGCGRDETHLRRAVELGVIDSYETDPGQAVKGADMVMLAVPVGAMEDLYHRIMPHLSAHAAVTDAGSTKQSVLTAVRAACGFVPPYFVAGHPIAGTEQSGVEASFAELYQKRKVILTPEPDTDPEALRKVRAMWEACGATVVEMPARHHDEVLAATSHLPHLLAYSLVDTLATLDDKAEIFEFAAGGFRDFTRIASSDPQMWHDVCLHNGPALLAVLELFEQDLDKVRAAIAAGDGEYLFRVFSRAKAARDQFCLR